MTQETASKVAETAAEHTPGPWEITEARGPKHELVFHKICGPDGNALASTWAGPHAANARLITAAPDLLATLKIADASIRNHLRGGEVSSAMIQKHAVAAIRAAIAKAEGRS